jgi:endogenous inhibitor of DNA gyrase (YacG/DUF329 family)
MPSSPVIECPTCKRATPPRAENVSFPFCSGRCKAVDLGRWLGGEYRIPVTSSDEDDDGALPSDRQPTDA